MDVGKTSTSIIRLIAAWAKVWSRTLIREGLLF